ncbi:unnamed protein product [Cercopithifilaria johnstoni]|uniref:Adenylyl cyclase-associated protein n=1 Tax=Cercopithifilaria johnstoni TaxID=2874296 RepID=A0A8J2LWF8_9BILA|nr:unnamed protein product [Cercopithifilaria johnstoni]
MFFQSPRPFGQHSTSYRSMSSNIHSSSSMTSLQTPEPKSGRTSAPPISFASIYEGSRFGSSGPSMNHTSINNRNFEQAKISKDSSLVEVIKNVEGDRLNIVNSARSSTSSTLGFKNYEKYKATPLHDSVDSGGTSGRSLNSFQSEVRIPISKSNVFQVQHRNVSQQIPPWLRQTQTREPQSEQILQNVSLYRKEYHHPVTSKQGNRFRSDSTVPFAEHAPKPVVIQSQPASIFSTGEYANVHGLTREHGSCSETRVSSSAHFNASQVPFNEQQQQQQQQQQKPIAYQQLERRKNYATLHHIASPKIGPLQRRTSDPNLIKINDNGLSESIAMFNVAKGVRAELEQDPKFRRKADILSSRISAEPITDAFSSPTLKEQPKQSPSLRQMENFFEQSVQQFHDVLGTKRPPSAKPFNLEHVRSIFRTNNTVRTESPSAIPTSMDAQAKQDSPLLGKPIKVETHEAQEGMIDAKLKEDKRTSGIITRQMVSTSQSTGSAGSAEKLVEQKICSVSGTNKTNMQANPTTVVDKPAITTDTDKSPEMRKEITISQEQPIVSQDIAMLEKDYDSLTTFVTSQRLNQPFPVNDAAFVTGSGKTRNAAGPPGILVKDGNNIRSVNDSGIKMPKKVAFQCDNDSNGFAKNELEQNKSIESPVSYAIILYSTFLNAQNSSYAYFDISPLASAETPPSVVQYDDAVDEPLQRLLKLSADIGGDLQTVGKKLSILFTEQRNFIWLAAGQKEPSANELQAKLSPLVKLMEDFSIFKESKRNTPFFNHISAASEGIQALGWLTVKPTPTPFIKDMFEASMFFVNRVLKERKDDKIHTEWAKSWSDVLNALQKYVRQVHTTGLVWNSCPGTKPPALVKQVSSSNISSVGAPPPPPPPVLPPDLFAAVSSEANASTNKSDRAALFAEINAGEKITKRLKKVTPDMQTHKNPELRSQKEVGAETRSKKMTVTDSTSPVKNQEDKPPKTWLDNGKQWNVEYYKNNNNVMVEVSNMKQTVYVFKCENTVIQIKGKVNSVTLDSCKKTSVVFDSLLSQLEVINCQSVQIQTLGAMPTLSIQKTDGCQVYLSKNAINAEIITSKSSEMNVLVPGAEDGDFVEFAVPEQFKTVYDGQKLKTTVSDIC